MEKLYPKFDGVVENGKIKIFKREKLVEYISTLNGRVEIVIRKQRRIRSLNANKYYWGVVLQLIAEYTGFSVEETHDAMKMKFLRKQSKGLETICSTARLSSLDFTEYLNKVINLAETELEITVPLPNTIEAYL